MLRRDFLKVVPLLAVLGCETPAVCSEKLAAGSGVRLAVTEYSGYYKEYLTTIKRFLTSEQAQAYMIIQDPKRYSFTLLSGSEFNGNDKEITFLHKTKDEWKEYPI